MFEHRGVQINVVETAGFARGNPFSDTYFTVDAGDRLVFVADSEYGVTFALTGPEALDLAKRQIDRVLDK